MGKRNETLLRQGDAPVEMVGKAFVVNLDWTFADDLDLAAVCVGMNGERSFVYYGDEGSRSKYPFAHLAHHSDGDGRSKHRTEHLVIADALSHESIYLFIWDHEATEAGKKAAFSEKPDSYELTVTDVSNRRVHLDRVEGAPHNCLLLGVITNRQVTAYDVGMSIPSTAMHLSMINEVVDELRSAAG